MRRDAPSTLTNSYSDPASIVSPSTSKNVTCTRLNPLIGVVVPVCTAVKSNSVARNITGVPSAQLASAVTAAPVSHNDVRTPKPKHAYPSDVNTACVADVDTGDTYSVAIVSAYSVGLSLTLTSKSNTCSSHCPTLVHRSEPPGNAPPVVSVAANGTRDWPV